MYKDKIQSSQKEHLGIISNRIIQIKFYKNCKIDFLNQALQCPLKHIDCRYRLFQSM